MFYVDMSGFIFLGLILFDTGMTHDLVLCVWN